MKTEKNPRGAGRKPLPYKTVRKYIPVDLESTIDALIKEYKECFKDGDNK